VYVAATYHQLHAELTAVPESDFFSYGVRRATRWVAALSERVTGGFAWHRPWDVLLLLLGVGLGWLASRRLRPGLQVSPRDPGEQRDLDLFWAGACVYVGSYAVVISFDYRLIFLLLIVPQLVRWARARYGLAYATAAALVVAMWLDEWTGMPGVRRLLDWWARTTAVGTAPPLTVAVVAQFLLFVMLVGWLLATRPALRRPRS
jgi:hypothetical protein